MGDVVIDVFSVLAFLIIGFTIGFYLIKILPAFVFFTVRDSKQAVSDSIAETITISQGIPGAVNIIYEIPNSENSYKISSRNKIIFIDTGKKSIIGVNEDEIKKIESAVKDRPSSSGVDFTFKQNNFYGFNFLTITKYKGTEMKADRAG